MQIGELAQRTGLTVKTVRYYSDVGLVPGTERTASGYRRYDSTAVGRVDFVRTMRKLGLDLATIRKIVERHVDFADVAAAHAEALDAQIRVLRLQRAVCRALARRDPTTEEVERMSTITLATAAERRKQFDEFMDKLFAGTEDNEYAVEFARQFRSAAPELPEDPTDEQVDAWLEFSNLIRDESFLAHLREIGYSALTDPNLARRANWLKMAAVVVDTAGEAQGRGVDPTSADAAPIVDELVGVFATDAGRTDTPEFRREVMAVVKRDSEPRAERYWQLFAIITGREPIPTTTHVWQWFLDALDAHS
jgi:DNA-binding transcriptional MerR regulator